MADTEPELADRDANAEKGPNYKTRLCQFYPKPGCVRGDSCKYAHGEKDLRAEGVKPVSPVKYKTKDCKYGDKCMYKARCFYKHDELKVCSMWKKTGKCLFGEGGGCPFLHGKE